MYNAANLSHSGVSDSDVYRSCSGNTEILPGSVLQSCSAVCQFRSKLIYIEKVYSDKSQLCTFVEDTIGCMHLISDENNNNGDLAVTLVEKRDLFGSFVLEDFTVREFAIWRIRSALSWFSDGMFSSSGTSCGGIRS